MDTQNLSMMRREYASEGLTEAAAGRDPLVLFENWLREAVTAGVHEPNAMALATADLEGRPSVRIVLLKGLDRDGAVFFSNYESQKGTELAQNPWAAASMLWHELGRQVRFGGHVSRLDAAASDEYYLIRPEASRISAAASPQSAVVVDRTELEQRWQLAEEQDSAARRPEFWGGYRIEIESFEFWQGRENRLHDRIRFRRAGDQWIRERLAP